MTPSFSDYAAGDRFQYVETWTHYRSVDDAEAVAKHLHHDDRELRVMLVVDGVGTFVERIER